jgi:hypothetical protein
MFKVYLGVNDITFLNKGTKPSSPGIEAAVSNVIKVRLFLKKLFEKLIKMFLF